MVNLITGIVAILGLVIFLGNYAYQIGSLPLWIIIVGVMLMPLYDFIRSKEAASGGVGENESHEDGD